ncbi:RNA-binding S4 domain-containing protein [Burkholderia sp. LMU1-1-1.1]|uniref:RNA-binding S4 domain-containing protein n=1 Tax=Burkholderia sp. LMU1-1-1.1 TaxID=3135266 RepID=UPI00341C7646
MSESVRLDKWLWAARFFKTRSLATDAVDAGKVKVNGDKVKPARTVRIGDKLDIDNGSDRWEIDVMNLSDVRQAAPIARNLYEETDESVERRANVAENRKMFREPSADFKGRPTKRDRRQMGKFGGAD